MARCAKFSKHRDYLAFILQAIDLATESKLSIFQAIAFPRSNTNRDCAHCPPSCHSNRQGGV
jgi:hypothetical protein